MIGLVRYSIDNTRERQFLLNLLNKIGRDGLRDSRYKHSYVDFAHKLTELRTRFNVVDASLILQESAFRRWAIREDDVDIDDDKRFELLEEALTAVETALNGIDNGRSDQQNKLSKIC